VAKSGSLSAQVDEASEEGPPSGDHVACKVEFPHKGEKLPFLALLA
jgi:hypothetical protein